jgi:SAM-dependent methyltransferase
LPRYAREWCEAQAACAVLDCPNPEADADERLFQLSPAMAEVMTDPVSLAHLAPAIRMTMAAGRALPELVKTYRGERTFGWEDHGPEMRQGQADSNRPVFDHLLARQWLPAIPDLHQVLSGTDRKPRLAEVGCGMGWASLALARQYPGLHVDGYDIDAPSIEAARRNADEAGLGDRVTFHVADVADTAIQDGLAPYDAVLAFECLHDMSRPVEVLAAMRTMLGGDGSLLVVDERTEDRFTPDAPVMERLLYGYSLTVCLPDGMSATPSAGTGTVMRPDTLRSYAAAAGFADVEILDIDHDQFRIYRLRG